MLLPCQEDPDAWFEPDMEWNTDGCPEETGEYLRQRSEQEHRAVLRCLLECPLVEECRELGKDEQYGVWGGTTPAERKILRAGQPLPLYLPPVMHSARREQVVKLFLEGCSLQEIATMLGTKRSSVRQYIRECITLLHYESGSASAEVAVA